MIKQPVIDRTSRVPTPSLVIWLLNSNKEYIQKLMALYLVETESETTLIRTKILWKCSNYLTCTAANRQFFNQMVAKCTVYSVKNNHTTNKTVAYAKLFPKSPRWQRSTSCNLIKFLVQIMTIYSTIFEKKVIIVILAILVKYFITKTISSQFNLKKL